MKRVLAILLVFALMLSLSACGEKTEPIVGVNPTKPQQAEEVPTPDAKVMEDKLKVVIDTQYGEIHVTLDPEAAPITVANFQKLVGEGFYDGLTFHRIMAGFMIQGGDPQGDGYGGSDTKIPGEFAANGVENNISHERGVISMARGYDFNSASSQFFIMHQTNTTLDGQYAAFGHVTAGMEVVDTIAEKAIVEDGNGTVLPENQIRIHKIYFE